MSGEVPNHASEFDGDSVRKVKLRIMRRKRRRRARIQYLSENIPGIGPLIGEGLVAEFGPVPNINNATLDELQEVPGVGPVRAGKIRTTLDKK